MPRHSYREHDYTFGQAMLTLRTNLGLTQAGLGVSRRAIGEKADSNSPKAEHFQHLLELCVQQHIFAPGQEEEEIRAVWKTAHQPVLLDEDCLSALLTQPSAPIPGRRGRGSCCGGRSILIRGPDEFSQLHTQVYRK